MPPATCFKCGANKSGALLTCTECGTTPRLNAELALSLVLTDHLSSETQLAQYNHDIRNHLKLSVPPDALAQAQDALKDPQLMAMLGAQPTSRASATPVPTAAPSHPTAAPPVQSARNTPSPQARVQRTLKSTALHQAPFALLGVTTRDDRRRIVELAEDKSLELDHDVCQKARSDLTNPRTRLRAEIAWLPRVDHIVGEQQDAALVWATAMAQRKTLAKAVYLADRVRVERPDLHEHLMRFIRFEPQKGPYGDGLPLGNLEAGPLGEMYLRGLRPWHAMHAANLIGLGRLMPLHGALSVLRSGGVALLLANGEAEADIVRAGMAWQRAWCALEHMGYALQPLAALPLLHLRIRLGDAETLSPFHVSLLEKAWNLLAEALPHPSDKLPGRQPTPTGRSTVRTACGTGIVPVGTGPSMTGHG